MTFHLWKPWKKLYCGKEKVESSWYVWECFCLAEVLRQTTRLVNGSGFHSQTQSFRSLAALRLATRRWGLPCAQRFCCAQPLLVVRTLPLSSIQSQPQNKKAMQDHWFSLSPLHIFFSVSEEWVIKHQNWHKMNIFTVQLWNFRSCFKITVA